MLRKGDTVVIGRSWRDEKEWGKVAVLHRDQFKDSSVLLTFPDGSLTSAGYAKDVYKVEPKPDPDRDIIDNLVGLSGGYRDEQAWQRLVARLTPLTD